MSTGRIRDHRDDKNQKQRSKQNGNKPTIFVIRDYTLFQKVTSFTGELISSESHERRVKQPKTSGQKFCNGKRTVNLTPIDQIASKLFP